MFSQILFILFENRTQNSFVLSPTEKDELALIIYLFDSIKSIGSNNIPAKILYYLKMV